MRKGGREGGRTRKGSGGEEEDRLVGGRELKWYKIELGVKKNKYYIIMLYNLPHSLQKKKLRLFKLYFVVCKIKKLPR